MLKFSYTARPVFLALLLVVVAFVAGLFTAGIHQNQIKKQAAKNLQAAIARNPQKNPCQLYGFGDIEQYMDKYTIKQGDSLLLISKTQLGDSSRINEIIALNKDKYPALALQNYFIEVGWKFLLPPQRYGITNGAIYVVHGNLSVRLSETHPGWETVWFNRSAGLFFRDDLKRYSHLNFKEGDCITVVYQVSTPTPRNQILFNTDMLKVLEVLKQ